ncbi:YTH-domain-containing protein [Ascodesmis nigricans]|uniref:YTH-domain-containing protein n=1 Tax=Ascodesmis nigricans TaxID=341454 RepID=A0A4S2MZ42_9PEZI|nr:YTH-domain-containing protein [Ascodesmis nigricans]
MEDLDMYDDRPLDDTQQMNNQAVDDRIPVPTERPRGTRVEEQSAKDPQNRTLSEEECEAHSGTSGKDPEKLRQKVLESLAEKKKKAAVFMNEGVMKKDGSAEAVSGGGSVDSGHENPEREAAVDALLATFGSKEKRGEVSRESRREGASEKLEVDVRHSRDYRHRRGSPDDVHSAPSHADRQSNRAEYGARREEYNRIRQSDYNGRSDAREYRDMREHDNHRRADHDGNSRRAESHYREDRGRFEDAKIKGRAAAAASSSSERYTAPATGDTRSNYRAPPRDDYYKAPESHHETPRKESLESTRPHRYPPPDMDYPMPPRDYAYLPPPPTRYAAPLDDPRYPPPPAMRGPEPDYATIYYRDLTEWLEITGYHDLPYRNMQLERHRAMEASRHYVIAHDDPAYMSRPPATREEFDSRHGGRASYGGMPPPAAGWDDRDAPPRPLSRGAYPPSLPPKERYTESTADKSSLKRRISARDEENRDVPSHTSKSARLGYDDPYRRPATPIKDEGIGARRSTSGTYGNEPVDDKDSVRRSLADRISRRDASPGEERRRRSQSRGYDSGYQGRSYDNDYRGRGRGRGYGRGGNNGDWDRNGDDYSSRGRGYGRGKGRGRGGYGKDYHSPDRFRHDIRDGPNDSHLEEARNNPIRYFIIKSYNEENVKIAQDECVWATQQKNTEILQEAFDKSEDVILFFSINKSGKFQGYARMEGPPGSAPIPSWSRNLLWESSGPFPIRWITITDISFHRIAHLRNRYNDMHPVLIGRDGQEIDPDCGELLCKSINETAEYRRQHTSEH